MEEWLAVRWGEDEVAPPYHCRRASGAADMAAVSELDMCGILFICGSTTLEKILIAP